MRDLPAAAALFDQMADAVYLLDPQSSHVVWANRAAWEVLGLTAEQVLDHSVLSLQMDVIGMPQWTEIAEVIRRQPPYVFIGRHRHREGHEVPVEVVTTCFMLDGREYFLSVARDVTLRLSLEREVRERQHQLSFALNEAIDGLWDWDMASGELYFSPQLKRMLGYGPDEMAPVLSTWSGNVHPDDAAQVMRVLTDHLEGRRSRYEAEYRLRNRNGHYLWVSDRGRVCERDVSGAPTRVVGMVQDITDQKMLQFKLEELAANDTLTGLSNRRHGEAFLDSQLALCARVGMPLGLCLVDIDHFKVVNDLHGHLLGDRVLRAVAQAMAGELRRSDLAYRWGGDEFVVVCPDTGLPELRQVAEKVRAALLAIDGAALGLSTISASIGVAVYPDHGEDVPTLMASADAALYLAKAAGRDRIEVARPMDSA
ncbi:sensor domain-containing diguanylate cyclase [Sphaerotilus mobilis]|nr:diguanylate cyclase [Sphaerotilus mobilis]